MIPVLLCPQRDSAMMILRQWPVCRLGETEARSFESIPWLVVRLVVDSCFFRPIVVGSTLLRNKAANKATISNNDYIYFLSRIIMKKLQK
jgi:hypothetical protein